MVKGMDGGMEGQDGGCINIINRGKNQTTSSLLMALEINMFQI